jgi:hypothetical protein
MLPFGPETLSFRLLSRNVKVRIYKTVMLPVILYECETLSLTIREECRLRVFENRLLRKIFGKVEGCGDPGEVVEKLHNEELHDLYSPSSIIRMMKSRRMRWAGMQHE